MNQKGQYDGHYNVALIFDGVIFLFDTVGLNIFISENNIHGNYNYCYIHKHNRIRTKAI